jgi:hypothetical protein
MDSTELDVLCAYFLPEVPQTVCLHPESRNLNSFETAFLEAILHAPAF